MLVEKCFAGMCFIPMDPNGAKFFGFSEFLAGLALMILVWTIADVRYRFRIQVAPIPLQGPSFVIVSAIGVLTLLTDLWRVQGWFIPQGVLAFVLNGLFLLTFLTGIWIVFIRPSISGKWDTECNTQALYRSIRWIAYFIGVLILVISWQTLLAGLFLLTFLSWTWFAIFKSSTFDKCNAKRYEETLRQFILKGSPTELAVVADELKYSAEALVRYASSTINLRNDRNGQNNVDRNIAPSTVEESADGILRLMANKHLCQAIVESSPDTALAIFQAVSDNPIKYDIQVEGFAKTIVDQALSNKDSFLYHKGHALSQTIFANSRMVATVGKMLDPDTWRKSKWDAAQWNAYCQAVLLTFRDHVKTQSMAQHDVLCRAMSYITHATSDLYLLNDLPDIVNDLPDIGNNDLVHRLDFVIVFIKGVVDIINDEEKEPSYVRFREREWDGHYLNTHYDCIAKMIFQVICHTSAIRTQLWIQYNSVRFELFDLSHYFKNSAGREVRRRVRHLLYAEIVNMCPEKSLHDQGARVLGYCLSVMGLELKKDQDNRGLHKVIITWTKENYAWLHDCNPRAAKNCLVNGMTYDTENRRLTWTSLSGKSETDYLEVDPKPADET